MHNGGLFSIIEREILKSEDIDEQEIVQFTIEAEKQLDEQLGFKKRRGSISHIWATD
jgi:hypothetical protein